MKIADKERIKKIVNTWASLQKQILIFRGA